MKAVRMALIHDLAEAETGDLTPMQKEADPEANKRAEDEAMVKLFNKLPESIRDLRLRLARVLLFINRGGAPRQGRRQAGDGDASVRVPECR